MQANNTSVSKMDQEIKSLLHEAIDSTNKTQKITGTQNFIDPLSHDVIWLVTFKRDDGDIEQWPVSFVGFLNTGGIWFLDSNGNVIKLHKQYNYMLIKLDDWTHDGYRMKKEVIINPKSLKKSRFM